jgi:hypothetical protein
MPVTIKLNFAQMRSIENQLRHIPGGIDKAISRASKRVASQGRTLISKEIRSKVNIKKKNLDKKVLSTTKSGKRGQLLRLKKTASLPLKYFDASQTKQGVKYKIGKDKGWQIAQSAFGPLIPRLGNHVFRRYEKGKQPKKYKGKNKARGKRFDNLPIYPLFGVSPWGVFVKNKMLNPTAKKLQDKFFFQVKIEADKLIRQKMQQAK